MTTTNNYHLALLALAIAFILRSVILRLYRGAAGAGIPASTASRRRRLGAWWHNRRVSRKYGHRRRQRQSQRVIVRLREIQGDEGQCFARRLAYLRKIDPLVFEEVVLDAYERRGHTILRSARYSGDGGIDGRVLVDDEWRGVQCKRYRREIKWEHIEQFPRDLAREGLSAGFFVHTGRTPPGHRWPAGVEVVSGRKLLDLLIDDRGVRNA